MHCGSLNTYLIHTEKANHTENTKYSLIPSLDSPFRNLMGRLFITAQKYLVFHMLTQEEASWVTYCDLNALQGKVYATVWYKWQNSKDRTVKGVLSKGIKEIYYQKTLDNIDRKLMQVDPGEERVGRGTWEQQKHRGNKDLLPG